jgi:hypothetical protein
MENMLPGNSFPQICVVSINECLGLSKIAQDYGTRVHESNHLWLL